MSGQKRKRSHWVSQAYLRSFAADSERKKIWTFSKNEGDPSLRPIRNVAVRFYLYAPRGPEGRDYSFEDKLASLEQLFGSPYWRGITTGFVDLCTPAPRKTVALLAAVLYLRKPMQLALTEDIHRSMAAFLSEHPELPEAMEINGRESKVDPASWPACCDASEDDVRRMWLNEVGSAAWLAQIFLEMRWAVMISDEPVFITTDNPVVSLHPELRFRGFKNPDTSVVLPLSPTRLLWLDNRRHEPDGQYLSAQGQRRLRERVAVAQCDRAHVLVTSNRSGVRRNGRRRRTRGVRMIGTIPGMQPDFDLTPDEQKLLATVNFDALALRSPADATRNGNAVRDLMKSLIARKAIPEVRRKYFTDPKYYPGGRGRTRQQDFERNGRHGDEILQHPHFLEFLRYFLYGADLPPRVIAEFRSAVERCGQVTSSDVVPLGKLARQLARTHHLKAHEASEEFHKLALDCGMWHRDASHIRDAVRKMR